MTKQDTFNIVVAHARKQKKQAIGSRGDCRYRMPNGMKCFVGVLIPDSEYRPSMEGKAADTASVRRVLESLGHNVALCEELQGVHDNEDPMHWESGFKAIAKDHRLKYSDVR